MCILYIVCPVGWLRPFCAFCLPGWPGLWYAELPLAACHGGHWRPADKPAAGARTLARPASTYEAFAVCAALPVCM